MTVALWVFMSTAAVAAFLFFAIKPALARLVNYAEAFKSKSLNANIFAFTLTLLFLSAWTTDLLGLDGIFGGL